MTTDNQFGTKFTCEMCGVTKPPEEMRSGMKNCHLCMRAKAQDQRFEVSKVARRTAFKTLVAGIRGNQINVPHTSEVAAEMIRLFGGLERFCAEWKTDLDLLRVEKPGSKSVLDTKAAILKLIVESTNQRDSAPDLAGLSDQELEKEFAGIAVVLIKNNPEVLEELLEEAGKAIVNTTDSVVVEDGRNE
tara:strand:- start:564 stop:1130 length:567 start_codon:yes stop_codon:yes gene_type:complete